METGVTKNLMAEGLGFDFLKRQSLSSLQRVDGLWGSPSFLINGNRGGCLLFPRNKATGAWS